MTAGARWWIEGCIEGVTGRVPAMGGYTLTCADLGAMARLDAFGTDPRLTTDESAHCTELQGLRPSELDARAELDDAGWRDVEEVGCRTCISRHETEQPLPPPHHRSLAGR